MNEQEKLHYVAARSAFIAAFEQNYAEGKRQLAEGKAEALRGVERVFYVEVPSDDVVQDRWREHVAKFEQAGRRAALAWRRTREARLDSASADPSGVHASATGTLRWTVTVNHVTGG
jgi:hypothetical protein